MDYFLAKSKKTYFRGVLWHYPQNEILSQKSHSISFLTFQKNDMSHFGENTFTYWHADSSEIIGSLLT